MITSVARSGPLAASLVASRQAVPSGLAPIVTAFVQKAPEPFVESPPQAHTSYTLSTLIPKTSNLSLSQRAVRGIGVSNQVRYAHTDIQVPDFSSYRRDSVKSSSSSNRATADNRNAFTYLIVAGGSVTCAYAAKNVVTEFISTMTASADVLALAKIEIKLGDIPEGKSATFKWRNKPLFVRHRTAEEIEKEEAVDVATLRHQEADSERVQKPEWLVLLGVCTHLGCVPIAGVGEYGGYYCPCHGSHYDASGRIRKGPAPLNLEVPEYEFMDEETLVVG